MLKGRVEVITGCMFSGKTSELIRRVERSVIAKRPVIVFKPDIDNRCENDKVETHSCKDWPAVSIPNSRPEMMLDLVGDAHVVGIEEAQFFAPGIVKVAETLALRGIRVIINGLDMDAGGQPFGPMPFLLAIAERVDKLTAVCTVCGEDAIRSQRLTSSTDLVETGGADKYAARCIQHFIPASI